MERLGAHPRIGAYGELLLRDRDGWPNWPPGADDRPFLDTYLRSQRVNRSRFRSRLQLYPFLDYVYAPRRGFHAIGFKLMYDEATPFPELLPYLRSRRIKILHLVRENLLDIAISQMGTTMRKHVHAWSPGEREDIRIHVDIGQLRHLLRRIDYQRRLARRILTLVRLEVHELTYESLLQNDLALESALKFLGVDGLSGAELSSRLLKLAPFSHRAGIANFDQVAACLAGTRYRRFLHD